MRFYLCRIDGKRRLLTRQDEAKKADPNNELVDYPVDQAGLKALLEGLFDQIDDAEYINDFTREADLPHNQVDTVEAAQRAELAEEGSSPSPSPPPRPEQSFRNYTDLSVAIDEVFENLPLGHQLHLAALAMENARKQIKPRIQDSAPVTQAQLEPTE